MPINHAMNRPRTKLGITLPVWFAFTAISVLAFLFGFRLLAVLSFPILSISCWLVIRKHPKMFELWGLSFRQKNYYDPRKS